MPDVKTFSYANVLTFNTITQSQTFFINKFPVFLKTFLGKNKKKFIVRIIRTLKGNFEGKMRYKRPVCENL